MKKFVFQLDALFKIKAAQKEKLQKEYSEAEISRVNAVRKKELLEKKMEDENTGYQARVKKGMTAGEIGANSVFFEDLQKQQKTAEADAKRAGENAERKQRELLEIFREIKTLEKLREKQYEAYLAEAEKREESVIEDILSFNLEKNAEGKAVR